MKEQSLTLPTSSTSPHLCLAVHLRQDALMAKQAQQEDAFQVCLCHLLLAKDGSTTLGSSTASQLQHL
eukprot:CAMPEP_0178373036 /NCGR_PEP_ID=MMETSP0689_2-20121128/1659_1 /TAXON_ID=160604 /ORGANISM="Amphidinium massartii, Strain CS-259" /LENGTH=67 /DNA_ID=CAMNT_0019992973 /DNA_START=71 /DNA_END=275 /DNA_ORIENTATION=-